MYTAFTEKLLELESESLEIQHIPTVLQRVYGKDLHKYQLQMIEKVLEGQPDGKITWEIFYDAFQQAQGMLNAFLHRC